MRIWRGLAALATYAGNTLYTSYAGAARIYTASTGYACSSAWPALLWMKLLEIMPVQLVLIKLGLTEILLVPLVLIFVLVVLLGPVLLKC